MNIYKFKKRLNRGKCFQVTRKDYSCENWKEQQLFTQQHILSSGRAICMQTKRRVWKVRKVFALCFFGLTNSRTTKVAKSFCNFSTGDPGTELSPESRLGLCGTRTHTDGTGAWLLLLLFDVATTICVFWWTKNFCPKIYKSWNEKNQKPNIFACEWIFTPIGWDNIDQLSTAPFNSWSIINLMDDLAITQLPVSKFPYLRPQARGNNF